MAALVDPERQRRHRAQQSFRRDRADRERAEAMNDGIDRNNSPRAARNRRGLF